jgi:hypothetical protein
LISRNKHDPINHFLSSATIVCLFVYRLPPHFRTFCFRRGESHGIALGEAKPWAPMAHAPLSLNRVASGKIITPPHTELLETVLSFVKTFALSEDSVIGPTTLTLTAALRHELKSGNQTAQHQFSRGPCYVMKVLCYGRHGCLDYRPPSRRE